jgi:hypothetical protein
MRLRGLPWLLACTLTSVVTVWLFARVIGAQRGVVPGAFLDLLKAWEVASTGLSPYLTLNPPFSYSPAVLALLRHLPKEPGEAWRVVGTWSVLGLALPVLALVRYRGFRQVALLGAGFTLALRGAIESVDQARPEPLMFALTALGAACFETVPVASGLLIGILPAFRLSWTLLFLPFFLSARSDLRRREHRFRRFLTGYLMSWFAWFAAIPSLTFGADRAQQLSQDWVWVIRGGLSRLAQQPGWPSLGLSGVIWILAGLALGRLIVVQYSTTQINRIEPRRSMGWIAPWMLFAQWVSPFGGTAGGVFALGAPFAWERRQPDRSRGFWALSGALLAVLWFFQRTPGSGGEGVASLMWLLLVWMS